MFKCDSHFQKYLVRKNGFYESYQKFFSGIKPSLTVLCVTLTESEVAYKL